MRRGRGRRGDHALAGLLFNLGQSVRRFGGPPIVNFHSGRLGRRWGRFSLPGWFRGVSTAYSTLAAAETVPGRGPITQCRLLLGGKQT